jgi:tRNA U55 pseudouridine synthase TruB
MRVKWAGSERSGYTAHLKDLYRLELFRSSETNEWRMSLLDEQTRGWTLNKEAVGSAEMPLLVAKRVAVAYVADVLAKQGKQITMLAKALKKP